MVVSRDSRSNQFSKSSPSGKERKMETKYDPVTTLSLSHPSFLCTMTFIHFLPSFLLGCQLKTAAAVDCSWPLDSTLDVCVVVLQLQVTGTRTSTFTAMPRLHNPPIKGRNLIVIHSTVLCKYRRLPPSFLPSPLVFLSFFPSFSQHQKAACQVGWSVTRCHVVMSR